MDNQQTISSISRQNISDRIVLEQINWAGRLEENVFLARLYDVSEMPSTDPRCENAVGDIWMHRDHFVDWPDDWVFSDSRIGLMKCSDKEFLAFLCETVHPAVRADLDEANSLVQLYNKILEPDGWAIGETDRISGHPVFSPNKLISGTEQHFEQVELVADGLKAEYIRTQIARIRRAVRDDPELAIGTAKELIETICKAIITEYEGNCANTNDFPKLVKKTLSLLQLTPEDVENETKAAETIRVLLNSLANITSRLAELRNQYGTGHGKKPGHGGLESRHAALAANCSVAICSFLYETYRERSKV